jgi:hypothetical protein
VQASGLVPIAELSERLSDLRDEQSALESEASTLRRQVALSSAASTVQKDARATLGRAYGAWVSAEPQAAKEIARLVSMSVGGLYVDGGGLLLTGRELVTSDPVEGLRRLTEP